MTHCFCQPQFHSFMPLAYANPFMMPPRGHCGNNIWNSLFAFNIMSGMINNLFAYQRQLMAPTQQVVQPTVQPSISNELPVRFDSNNYFSLNSLPSSSFENYSSLNSQPSFDYSAYFSSFLTTPNNSSTSTISNLTTLNNLTSTTSTTSTESILNSLSSISPTYVASPVKPTNSTASVTPTNSSTQSKITLKRSELVDIACRMAKKYGVDERLVLAVIQHESGFKNGQTSSRGAKGIMQLMPATAREMGVTDINNPTQNIEGGVKYLKKLLDKYNGNVKLALAAYNAGPGNVAKYGGVPPFRETQNYVNSIYNSYQKYQVA